MFEKLSKAIIKFSMFVNKVITFTMKVVNVVKKVITFVVKVAKVIKRISDTIGLTKVLIVLAEVTLIVSYFTLKYGLIWGWRFTTKVVIPVTWWTLKKFWSWLNKGSFNDKVKRVSWLLKIGLFIYLVSNPLVVEMVIGSIDFILSPESHDFAIWALQSLL
jgi:hypothetical protein